MAITPQQASAAALLKGNPGIENMDDSAGIFAGPSPGHVPSAWELATSRANADDAATALGASPQLQGLRHAMDAQRLEAGENQRAEDADVQANGLNRATTRANIQNRVDADTSEARARMQLAPFASAVDERQSAGKLADLRAQYGEPAEVTAQGTIGAAKARAAGEIGAAQVHANSVTGLLAAFAKAKGLKLTDLANSPELRALIQSQPGVGSQVPQ